MITGETLRLLRNVKGYKQKSVADLLKISQPAYSKLEKSKKISKEAFHKIQQVLNLTEDDLENAKKLLHSPIKINTT